MAAASGNGLGRTHAAQSGGGASEPTVADMIVNNREAQRSRLIHFEWRADRWLNVDGVGHVEMQHAEFVAVGHAPQPWMRSYVDYDVQILFTLPLDRLHYDSLLFVRDNDEFATGILYHHDDEQPEFRVGNAQVNNDHMTFIPYFWDPHRNSGSHVYAPPPTLQGTPTATYTVYMYNRQGDGAAPRKIGSLAFDPHADPPTVMAEASPEELTRSRAHAFAHIASSDRRHDTDNYEHELQKTSEEGYRRMQKETFSGASTDKCCFTNLT
jgi:hypothetical protein